jgi:eukaryotic-like serine/threonine-protein kinase
MTPPPDEVDAPHPDPLVGRVVAGNFRLERLLGAGGMGNVYRAEQLSLGKPVAVKILHAELMADEVVVKRFEREARHASRLEHPNLVQIIDCGQDQDSGVLYIAMELLSGRDLGQVIAQDAPLPLHRIVRIMSQVFSALEEAHVQGVIHRDLKPANIMLVDRRGEQDQVKVCDFGIAKSSAFVTTGSPSLLTVRGFVCGTPEYMAPEQARGEEVDGRTDLYAAAVILYQMVTGEVPFTASSPVAILSQHLDHQPTPPSRKRLDVPPALDQLILKGLAKHPADRPATASSFRQALESVCSISSQGRHDRTLAAMVSPGTARRESRSRWWQLALLGGLVGAVGVASIAALRDQVGVRPPIAGPQSASASSSAAAPPVRATPVSASPLSAAAAPVRAVPAVPPAEAPAPLTHEVAPAVRHRARPVRAIARVVAPSPPTLAPSIPPPPSVPLLASEPAPSARELFTEAERLLSQGEVTQACARGEEARQLGPRVAAIYRFLGKCYMRSGNAARASDRYRTYLQLSPDASDAAFIRSLVR